MKIFISYKTEDANIARGIAERLLSNGIQVWFAEYEIMLEEYFVDDIETEKAIAKGAQTSTHAILLTNNRWVKAHWCQFEMQKLTENLRSIDKIVEVCIPREDEPHRKFNILETGDPIIFKGNLHSPSQAELDNLVYEIGKRLGINIVFDRDPFDINAGYSFRLPNYEVSFKPGPLYRTRLNAYDPKYSLRQATSILDLIRFQGRINEQDFVLHLFIHPFRAAMQEISVSQDEISDDRKVCNQYRKYAIDWFSKEGWKEHVEGSTGTQIDGKGLHVVFIDRQSHIGLTMKYTADKNIMWERRYIISYLEPGRSGKKISVRSEAMLNFSAKPSGDESSQFEQFHKLCQTFDAIAQTFRVNKVKGTEALFNNLPILISKSIFALLAWIGVYHFYTTSNPWWHTITASIIAGFFTFDIMNYIGRYSYRKLLWTQRPLANEYFHIHGTNKRFYKDLIYWLFSTPFTFFSTIFKCFKKKVGWILLITGAIIFLAYNHFGPESSTGLLSMIQIIAVSACLGGMLNIFKVSGYISGIIKEIKNNNKVSTTESIKKKKGEKESEKSPGAFIKFLREEDEVRVRFGQTSLVAAGADAIAPLIELLTNEQEEGIVRKRAATVLSKIGKPAITPLLEALKKQNLERKYSGVKILPIASALGGMGKPVVEQLILALGSKSREVRFGAAIALVYTGDIKAIDAVRNAANRGNQSDREMFEMVLSKLRK